MGLDSYPPFDVPKTLLPPPPDAPADGPPAAPPTRWLLDDDDDDVRAGDLGEGVRLRPPSRELLRAAEACLTDDAAPPKSAISAEAEQAAFLAGLRAVRNERVKRDATVAAAITLAIVGAAWLGEARPDESGRAVTPELAAVPKDDGSSAPLEEVGPPLPPTVEGKLGKAEVVAAVDRKAGQLKQCYALGFDRDPKLAGSLTMKLLVGESGDVLGVADVGSSVGDRSVVRCVARSMRSLALPAPSDGRRALVTYPLVVPKLR